METRKTAKMRKVEDLEGAPLEKVLAEKYNELGLPGMSQRWGVSKATLWYWLLKFQVKVNRVATGPTERVEVIQKPER